MSDCPIGLICELMVCNKRACSEYARPWPIPYEMEHWNCQKRAWDIYLEVSVREESWTDPNEEWQIIAEVEENRWISHIKEECFFAGWINAIDLPYEYRDGLYVIFNLALDKEITYSCPIDGFQSHYEGFYQAMSLTYNKDTSWYETEQKDEFGFYERLAWFVVFQVEDEEETF